MVMSITAAEIQNVRFGEARRGYNPDEVDEFLERVAGDIDTMNRALAEAAARLNDAEERTRAAEERTRIAEERLEQAAKATSPPPPQTPPPADNVVSEDVISRAFIAAQLSADKLKEEARKEAEKLFREADAKAKDIVRDAYSERERTLSEIEHLREASEQFRTEFLSLINHYSTDAQKRFAQFSERMPGTGSIIAPSPQTKVDPSNAASPNATAGSPVAASSQARASARTGGLSSTRPAIDPAATTAMPSAYSLDDDLEIEEID
jgi:cell division initiation protein